MKNFFRLSTLIVCSLCFTHFSFAEVADSQFVVANPPRTIKINPQPEPYKVVKALRNAGKLKEAKEKGLQYLRLKPNDVDVMLMLGIVYYQEKNYSQAEKYFHKVITIYPRYLDAYLLLVKARLAENNTSGALDAAKEGLKYFPSNQELQKAKKIATESPKTPDVKKKNKEEKRSEPNRLSNFS